MSLGMFHVLPLLRGWEWNIRWHSFVPTKEIETSYTNRGTGWLMELDIATDDAFGETELNFKGSSKSGIVSKNTVYPQYLYAAGTTQAQGFNTLCRYSRPSKTSSQGIFIIRMFVIGGGATLPILDRSLIKTRLLAGTSQTKCNVTVGLVTIDIINSEEFIKSIRAVEGTRNLHIDSSLLAGAVNVS